MRDHRDWCSTQRWASIKPRPRGLDWSRCNWLLLQHRTHSPFWLSATVTITPKNPRPSRPTIPRSLTPEIACITLAWWVTVSSGYRQISSTMLYFTRVTFPIRCTFVYFMRQKLSIIIIKRDYRLEISRLSAVWFESLSTLWILSSFPV